MLRSKNLKYNYGSTGPGSVMHVIGETFKRDAKVDMAHIAFKGAAPLKLDLLSGRIQVGGDQLSTSLAEIRAGQLKALATSGAKRIRELPDVPTVRELGFASLEFEGWNGLLAPARTPSAVIARLQRETAEAVRHPDVQKRFSDLGAEPVGSSAQEQDRHRAPADEAVHAGDPGDEARLSVKLHPRRRRRWIPPGSAKCPASRCGSDESLRGGGVPTLHSANRKPAGTDARGVIARHTAFVAEANGEIVGVLVLVCAES